MCFEFTIQIEGHFLMSLLRELFLISVISYNMHTKNKSSNYFLKVYSKWYWPTCMCTVNNFGLPACSHLQLPPQLDLFPLFLSPTKDHTEGSFKALFNNKLEQQQKIKRRKIPLLVFFTFSLRDIKILRRHNILICTKHISSAFPNMAL